MKKCEVCGVELSRDDDLEGCGGCGLFFGPCCNSVQDGRCVECVDPDIDDEDAR